MTRSHAIKAVAMQLCAHFGSTWQHHPNVTQDRVQRRRMEQAEEIIDMIEKKMEDFRWTPEQ